MASTIQLEMITPEKVALQTAADFVVLPAFAGEMGVLPGHEPYWVELKAGEVRVTSGEDVRSFAIAGGRDRDDRLPGRTLGLHPCVFTFGHHGLAATTAKREFVAGCRRERWWRRGTHRGGAFRIGGTIRDGAALAAGRALDAPAGIGVRHFELLATAARYLQWHG